MGGGSLKTGPAARQETRPAPALAQRAERSRAPPGRAAGLPRACRGRGTAIGGLRAPAACI